VNKLPPHEWDDDAVCIHCGFDGAEWWSIYVQGIPPGERETQPRCKPRDSWPGTPFEAAVTTV
jgi:hypothetical protein